MLLLTAHHLAVDVVSWHIMLGDLVEAWRCVNVGRGTEDAAGVHLLPSMVRADVATRRRARRCSAARILARAGPRTRSRRWVCGIRTRPATLGPLCGSPGWSPRLRSPSACSPRVTRDAGVREFLLAAATMAIASWRGSRAARSGIGHAGRAGGPWARRRGSRHRHHEHRRVVHQRLPGAARGGRGGGRCRAGRGGSRGGPGAWSSRWSAISVRSRTTVWTTACSVMSTASPSCRAPPNRRSSSAIWVGWTSAVSPINRGRYSPGRTSMRFRMIPSRICRCVLP